MSPRVRVSQNILTRVSVTCWKETAQSACGWCSRDLIVCINMFRAVKGLQHADRKRVQDVLQHCAELLNLTLLVH